ncbi:hypothetical protein [Ornithinibacillus halophilus]|uniref:Uncharacterized protein n=1 Tax=Ornithinibacillus halophilus TaxID=930117 RepID=A0A1M5GJS6_9BACI|nr:hypothetical protein [Ornithinibacillus halophilus]SHG03762.1 hypothetical protein SAMN05216225_101334 [Ornithinibacillus halophilus]
MKKHSNEKEYIAVRATPEMANWMHPKGEERTQEIQKRVEAAKERV